MGYVDECADTHPRQRALTTINRYTMAIPSTSYSSLPMHAGRPQFSDDESTKPVYMEAYTCTKCFTAPRHVRLYWINAHNPTTGTAVQQVVQVECGGPQVFKFFNLIEAPAAPPVYHLGHFTRDMREAILDIAEEVVDGLLKERIGRCEFPRQWMKRVQHRMFHEGLMHGRLSDMVALSALLQS
ncbi:hypothetical protein CYLTODRAFT_100308 [Cylindrobasidium torrendii FP15055 ss-10]|uniref:Uncharacterized protein n=1 Tax=Cylindrobasidium torrendii FP15055 ss-10 TaxID=1314674 RepID=A0A0D7B4Q8_9AGAR|nr:hypothetical protein CYLTODRAFT_100308 [Cylindrobasidium torrendii FP15055 ss-10]